MQITIHIGAHRTQGPMLLRALLKNQDALKEMGVIVPDPARYRDIMPDLMKRVKSEPASADSQDLILEQILDGETCERMVLGLEDIICVPQHIFDEGAFYGKASFKLPWLRNVFADHQVRFVVGMRNPASFIPAAYAQCANHRSYEDFMCGMNVEGIRWSNLLTTIRTACPDVPLIAYAYEDSPLTWARLLHIMAELPASFPLQGSLDPLLGVMQREGIARLRTYLQNHTPRDVHQFERIVGLFLAKYPDDEAMEMEIDLPGWDDALVERLTEAYEDDLYLIEDMVDITFVS